MKKTVLAAFCVVCAMLLIVAAVIIRGLFKKKEEYKEIIVIPSLALTDLSGTVSGKRQLAIDFGNRTDGGLLSVRDIWVLENRGGDDITINAGYPVFDYSVEGKGLEITVSGLGAEYKDLFVCTKRELDYDKQYRHIKSRLESGEYLGIALSEKEVRDKEVYMYVFPEELGNTASRKFYCSLRYDTEESFVFGHRTEMISKEIATDGTAETTWLIDKDQNDKLSAVIVDGGRPESISVFSENIDDGEITEYDAERFLRTVSSGDMLRALAGDAGYGDDDCDDPLIHVLLDRYERFYEMRTIGNTTGELMDDLRSDVGLVFRMITIDVPRGETAEITAEYTVPDNYTDGLYEAQFTLCGGECDKFQLCIENAGEILIKDQNVKLKLKAGTGSAYLDPTRTDYYMTLRREKN